MGDARTYENACALRLVESVDGMTADWAYLDRAILRRISNRIINEVRGLNRVVLDISSKPPSTIECGVIPPRLHSTEIPMRSLLLCLTLPLFLSAEESFTFDPQSGLVLVRTIEGTTELELVESSSEFIVDGQRQDIESDDYDLSIDIRFRSVYQDELLAAAEGEIQKLSRNYTELEEEADYEFDAGGEYDQSGHRGQQQRVGGAQRPVRTRRRRGLGSVLSRGRFRRRRTAGRSRSGHGPAGAAATRAGRRGGQLAGRHEPLAFDRLPRRRSEDGRGRG